MFRYLRSPRFDRWTAGFVAVLLAGAFVRLYRLGAESLWLDEIYSVLDVTTRSTGELVFMPFIKLHLPLYYLVLEAWVELVGVSEASVRIPSVVFGIAAIGAVYLVGTSLYDRPVGLLSGALLAFSRYHVHYSQEARMYSLLVLLTALSFYWLVRVARTGSRADVGGYLVTTLLLAYTHPFSLFVLLTQNLYVVTAPFVGGRDSLTIRLRRWIGLQAVVGALIAPWVLYAIYDVIANEGSPGWIDEPTLAQLASLPLKYVGWDWPRELPIEGELLSLVRLLITLLVVVSALFAATNRSLVRSEGRHGGPALERTGGSPNRAYLLALWATIPILAPAALSLALDPMLSVRYTIPASLGLFVLIAAGIRQLRYANLNVVLAALLVTSFLVPLAGYYGVEHRPEWEEATGYVDANAEPDDLVLVHYSPLSATPFRYYLDRNDLRIESVSNSPDNEGLRDALADEGTVWVVYIPPDGEHIRSAVEANHQLTHHRSYYDVEVYRYEPIDDDARKPSASTGDAATD